MGTAVLLLLGAFLGGLQAQSSRESHYAWLHARYMSAIGREGATVEDRTRAGQLLFSMWETLPDSAFAPILEALESDWPEVRSEAARWLGWFYVDPETLFTGSNPPKPLSLSSRVMIDAKRAVVASRLRALVGDQCLDIRVRAIGSLAAIDTVGTGDLEILCGVLSGDGLNRFNVCAVHFENMRREAFNILSKLENRVCLRPSIVQCYQSIVSRQAGASDKLLQAIATHLREMMAPRFIPEASRSAGGYLGNHESQLVYADVVVRATIEDIDTGYAREGTYWPGTTHPDRRTPTTVLHLRVTDVLRGRGVPSDIVATAPGQFPPGVVDSTSGIYTIEGYSFDFSVGDEVIYCFWRYPRTPDEYIVPSDDGRFVRSGGVWINFLREPVGIETIRSLVEEADPSRLARRAEVIVLGDIVHTATDTERSRRHVSMRVTEVLKGWVEEDSLEFVFVTRGEQNGIPMPDVAEGETWLVFLERRHSSILYPFAGVNGMLKREGDVFIRNNSVPYELSWSELKERIAEGRKQ